MDVAGGVFKTEPSNLYIEEKKRRASSNHVAVEESFQVILSKPESQDQVMP